MPTGEELRAVITAVISVILVAAVVIPVTRRLAGGNARSFARFKAQAIADGRAVTAYISRRGQYHGDRDNPIPSRRKVYYTGRYTYYVFPGGAKYETRRFTGPHLPDQIQLYLYPGNPRRYRTEWDRAQQGLSPLVGVLIYLAVGVGISLVYRLLGLFLP